LGVLKNAAVCISDNSVADHQACGELVLHFDILVFVLGLFHGYVFFRVLIGAIASS
jgi:hypothetical protein